jgi:hypothetical protein
MLCVAMLCGATVSCSSDAAPETVVAASGPCAAPPTTPEVFGGAATSARGFLVPEQRLAIPRLGREEDASLCTALVVAPNTAITAKHCVEKGDVAPPDGGLVLSFGSGSGTPVTVVPIVRVSVDDELDIAKLEFDTPSELAGLIPIPLGAESPEPNWLGSPAELAGFGLTAEGNIGDLFFAVEPIVDYDDARIVVDGAGRTGACDGDSGGPLLARANDGTLRAIGVLSQGSPTCTKLDYFSRGDLIAQRLEVTSATPPSSCQGLDSVGLCVRGQAVWCDGGSLRAEGCADQGLVCGWQEAAAGFRCLPAVEDPCQGRGSRRTCEDGALTECWAGGLETVQCGLCRSCVDWVDANGAGCQ